MSHEFDIHTPGLELHLVMTLEQMPDDDTTVLCHDTAAEIAHECLCVHRQRSEGGIILISAAVRRAQVAIQVFVLVHAEGSLLSKDFGALVALEARGHPKDPVGVVDVALGTELSEVQRHSFLRLLY